MMQARALRSDTKANLLSSAPPPVIAEALEPNEETVTSGRQLIARPASSYTALYSAIHYTAIQLYIAIHYRIQPLQHPSGPMST